MLGTSAMAQSVNLFEDLDPVQSQFVENEQGMLHRHVRINSDAAESVFKGRNLARSFSVEFEPGKPVTYFTTDRDTQMAPRTRIWSGRAEGPVDGSATIVYRRGGIVGHFQIGAETYRVTPQDDGIHMITWVNIQALPSEGSDMIEEE